MRGDLDQQLLERTLAGLQHGNCLDWMTKRKPNSVHAIVTDPPFAFREYQPEEVAKMREGTARGAWRLPPKLDGHERAPLPRFTTMTDKDIAALGNFFSKWAKEAIRILTPGAHIMIATTPVLSHLFYTPILAAGFEKRGEIVRLVQTLRGGDKPKNAEKDFADVTVIPRGGWEPWGLFRKPLDGRVQDTLRKWGTGGLRRESAARPFTDVIQSGPTGSPDRDFCKHPSLKPQSFMRQIVRAALPLGKGLVLDPFMGGGSTIAAAIAVGYESIGVELDSPFFDEAREVIPMLAAIDLGSKPPFVDQDELDSVEAASTG
jgi:site-specific DNA-methyltransferase (adenine-specific)